MTTGREEDSFVVGGNKSGWSAFATVEDHPRIPSLAWLWAAYEAAFTAANLVREDFLGALQFGEIDQKLGELDRDLTARYHGPIEYVIKYNSTGYRRIASEREGFDDLIERARYNCGEDVDAIGFFINTNSFVGELRAVGSEWIKIPISPFAFYSELIILSRSCCDLVSSVGRSQNCSVLQQ